MSAGQAGIIDFVGYSVGTPINPVPGGFFGFVDFTGIPVGVPLAGAGHVPQVAGKKPNKDLIRYLIDLEMQRVYDQQMRQGRHRELIHRSTAVKVQQEIEIKRRQKLLTATSVYTALLSEL